MTRSPTPEPDAVVVGSGPNGLAAAIEIARSGRRVLVVEAASTPGGGCRSEELTEHGFRHDVCSAVHPFAVASPFFNSLPLHEHGLEWVHPERPVAHPLENARAVGVARSIHDTADELGSDGDAWRRLVEPTVREWDRILPAITAPVLRIPRHPIAVARFGFTGLTPASRVVDRFERQEARAMFAGMAAHASVPLTRALTSSFGLVLAASAQVGGWPFPRGGAQSLTDALVSYLASIGGAVETGRRITSLDELPRAGAVLLDVSPAALVALAGDRLPSRYMRRLARFRYGPGVFKIDYALREPVPWAAEAARHAGTVHVGGSAEEIISAEAEVGAGRNPERPFILTSQPSLFDDTRAPAGRHTLWAYCHVPNGSPVDMTAAIDVQIERFAPGFSDVVLARHTMGPRVYGDYNANYVGGDIGTGGNDGLQALFRPMLRVDPYRTPADGIYLCSAATPPGGGVHGMCGYWAARSALRHSL